MTKYVINIDKQWFLMVSDGFGWFLPMFGMLPERSLKHFSTDSSLSLKATHDLKGLSSFVMCKWQILELSRPFECKP